jgi:3'-phosphoadenosine 5'-phosphosulfate sulfotransferase (PAPS reductase)/FAD synthetase
MTDQNRSSLPGWTLFGEDDPLAEADASHPLDATDAEVAAMSMHDRMERVTNLIVDARMIVAGALAEYVDKPRKRLVATCVLFSGGNDSTVLAHLFRDADYAIHANTTIGIEQTRQFVRDTCEAWGLALIERTPPNPKDHYRALVLDQGFPGPGHHFKMFQRLKERALRQAKKELVTDPRNERVVYLAGRRRQESERRANVPELERVGSIVWVSPLVRWTKPDLATYRQMFDVPRNEVADLCHMSGECLCGAFAHEGEREEIGEWFPEPFEVIAELEAEIADRTDIPEHRKRWGWGSDADVAAAMREQKAGRLCSSCDTRWAAMLTLFDELEASESASEAVA